jgi:hypothetical protein
MDKHLFHPQRIGNQASVLPTAPQNSTGIFCNVIATLEGDFLIAFAILNCDRKKPRRHLYLVGVALSPISAASAVTSDRTTARH